MNRRRTDHQIAHLADRLHRAKTVVPDVLDHLSEQMAHAVTVSAGSERTTTGDHSDPTANAAARRHAITDRRDAIRHAKNDVGQAIDRLEHACRQGLGVSPRVAADEPRCTGGDPSTWGDPTCGDLVEHYTRTDGTTGYRTAMLCGKHRKAKERYDRQMSHVPPQ